MPYSFKRQAEHGQKMFLRKIESIVDDAVTLTAEQITEDLSNTFDKCIDDFYSYETRSYYRHEVGKGTGTGWNLYLANNFQVNYRGGVATSIHFGWNGNEMLAYRPLNGKSIDADYVLDRVMEGVRFDGDGSEHYPEIKWRLSSSISTKYFGTLKGATPNSIFNQMIDKMYSVQRNLAKKNFSILYRARKNKRW